MKNAVSDLALFGGAAAFDDKLHVGRPNIGERAPLFARLNDMLDRRWLTNNGRYVQELERRIAEYVGVKHCIAMCNATVALEIARDRRTGVGPHQVGKRKRKAGEDQVGYKLQRREEPCVFSEHRFLDSIRQ